MKVFVEQPLAMHGSPKYTSLGKIQLFVISQFELKYFLNKSITFLIVFDSKCSQIDFLFLSLFQPLRDLLIDDAVCWRVPATLGLYNIRVIKKITVKLGIILENKVN